MGQKSIKRDTATQLEVPPSESGLNDWFDPEFISLRIWQLSKFNSIESEVDRRLGASDHS
jgi:hypothetical protein